MNQLTDYEFIIIDFSKPNLKIEIAKNEVLAMLKFTNNVKLLEIKRLLESEDPAIQNMAVDILEDFKNNM